MTASVLATRSPRQQLRRGLLVLAAVAILTTAGCTTVSRTTSESFKLLFKRNRVAEPTPAEVAAIPYPQILVHAPDVSGVLVLGALRDGQQAWFAGKHSVFRLQANGLLVGMDSAATQYSTSIGDDASPLNLLQVPDGSTIQRSYDWMPGYMTAIPVTGRLQRRSEDVVVIQGRNMRLLHVTEHLQGRGFSGRNEYWIDPASGFIWKSTQTLAPGYTVEITQLKPYRPAAI